MDRHPDDVTAADDLELVQAARTGDRLSFGVLYLRHHPAAWRIACVASRFSPDAELAVIEGFTRVFSALPGESEEFGTGHVSFRPYLLACVRQAALDRARAVGRAEAASSPARRGTSRPESPPAPGPLAGLTPDGEVVLASLEHHVSRGALAALPERSRTALWLTDVEAMTPGEVAGIVGGHPGEVAELTARARDEVRAGREAALGRHEVRSDCRFTVANLDTFAAGTLDPAKGVLVRSHLDICPPCRMRLGELANAPAALAAAVPAAPLLGGETQQHWLSSAGEVRPAERLLPPGVAAAAPAHRLPDMLRRAGRAAARSWLPEADPIGLTTSPAPGHSAGWTGGPGSSPSPTPPLPPAWTVPPGRSEPPPRRRDRRTRRSSMLAGVPVTARRAGRAVWPALPATVLVIAWLGVMVSLPHLMSPGTAPGPGGLALPAVQAYVPGFLPGAARLPVNGDEARGMRPVGLLDPQVAMGGGAVAAATTGGAERASARSSGPGSSAAARVKLIPTAVRPSGPGNPSGGNISLDVVPPLAEVAAITPLAVAAPGAEPISVAAAPAPAPGPALVAGAPARPATTSKVSRRAKPTTPRPDARPGEDAGPGTEAKARKEAKPRPELKPRDRGHKLERSGDRQDGPRGRQQPVRRHGPVTA